MDHDGNPILAEPKVPMATINAYFQPEGRYGNGKRRYISLEHCVASEFMLSHMHKDPWLMDYADKMERGSEEPHFVYNEMSVTQENAFRRS